MSRGRGAAAGRGRRRGIAPRMGWHRRLGLAAALWLVLVAVSGLLLNHSAELKLGLRTIESPVLLRWWGLPPPAPQAAVPLPDGHWLSQWGSRLWHDTMPLDAPAIEQLVGAGPWTGGWLVADRGQLLLFDPGGRLVERLGLPAGFVASRLGAEYEAGTGALRALRLRAADGRERRADPQAADWAELPADAPDRPNPRPEAGPEAGVSVQWSRLQALPAAMEARLAAAQPGGLSVERLLLDLHAGRWLGPAGVWLTDAAALALLLLAWTGLRQALGRAPRPPAATASGTPPPRAEPGMPSGSPGPGSGEPPSTRGPAARQAGAHAPADGAAHTGRSA